MDSRIKLLQTTDTNLVFFQINGCLDASHIKSVLTKKGYLQVDTPSVELEALSKKYYQENPYSTARLYFLSKRLGVECYQRTMKKGDSWVVQEQIFEKGFSFTFTGNPSLVLLESGDIVIMKKNTN